jgi:hypothetical protein
MLFRIDRACSFRALIKVIKGSRTVFFGFLLFIICYISTRLATLVVVPSVGMGHYHFGKDVERDIWELRRYAYVAYPVIQERKHYYHMHDSYPTYSDRRVNPGSGYIRFASFPYYSPYQYNPDSDLQEPVYYAIQIRIGPGTLLYDSSKKTWWLYGFDYMKNHLENFPDFDLITPP